MILTGDPAVLLALKDRASPLLSAFFWCKDGLILIPRQGCERALLRLAGAYRREARHKIKKTNALWEV